MAEAEKAELQQSTEDTVKENRSLRRQLRNLEATLERNKAMLAARTTINTMLEAEQKRMERNMDLLLENSADIILLFDKDGCFTYYTAAFAKAAGLAGADLIRGRHFTDVFSRLVSREMAETMQANYDTALAKRGTVVIEASIDLSGEGALREYDVQITPMMDQAGELEAVMMLLHDMTEIIRAKRQAESASLTKSQFLATMSHEIRTPMNAILGIAEIQLQEESLDAAVREAMSKIYASGDLLLGIINDILDLSKIESGKLELVIAPYEIASLVSDTVQLNIMRIGSKPIEFVLEIDERAMASLSGDELRVKQIINNILSNAFKYTAAGQVRMSLTTEAGGDGNAVILAFRISDTGQGMTKEQVDKLFDEYSRFNLEANRTTEGAGLGMSITRNLVSLMHGEIEVESEPGLGSAFTVRLPQGMVGGEVLGREMAENLRQFRTSSRARMRGVQITREPMPYGSVLIVDDVETNIYVAKGLLAPYGLQVESADSGFAAIEKVKRGKLYDVVFMDHMMPVMDGIEATKIIRDAGYTAPIVALTANAVSGQADVFLGNGFDDFLSKPIDVRQLNTVLNRFVRDKRAPESAGVAQHGAEAVQHGAEGKLRGEPAAGVEATLRGISADGAETIQLVDFADGTAPAPPALDPGFAEVFLRDARKSLAALEALAEKAAYADEDKRQYVVLVHGMKSALANIGRTELSAMAAGLEQAGRDGDMAAILAGTPDFLSRLRALADELRPARDDAPGAAHGTAEMGDPQQLVDQLLALKAACEGYNKKEAKEILTTLREAAWPQPTEDVLGEIAEHLLHSDFDEIRDVAERLLAAPAQDDTHDH